MGHSKLYIGKFLTCDCATCTNYGITTLCRKIAGGVRKAEKSWKISEIQKGQNLRKNTMEKSFREKWRVIFLRKLWLAL